VEARTAGRKKRFNTKNAKAEKNTREAEWAL
jgi:hypothetical protein